MHTNIRYIISLLSSCPRPQIRIFNQTQWDCPVLRTHGHSHLTSTALAAFLLTCEICPPPLPTPKALVSTSKSQPSGPSDSPACFSAKASLTSSRSPHTCPKGKAQEAKTAWQEVDGLARKRRLQLSSAQVGPQFQTWKQNGFCNEFMWKYYPFQDDHASSQSSPSILCVSQALWAVICSLGDGQRA